MYQFETNVKCTRKIKKKRPSFAFVFNKRRREIEWLTTSKKQRLSWLTADYWQKTIRYNEKVKNNSSENKAIAINGQPPAADSIAAPLQQQPPDFCCIGWLDCEPIRTFCRCALPTALAIWLGPIRCLISSAIFRNACSTFTAPFADVSKNGMFSESAYSFAVCCATTRLAVKSHLLPTSILLSVRCTQYGAQLCVLAETPPLEEFSTLKKNDGQNLLKPRSKNLYRNEHIQKWRKHPKQIPTILQTTPFSKIKKH